MHEGTLPVGEDVKESCRHYNTPGGSFFSSSCLHPLPCKSLSFHSFRRNQIHPNAEMGFFSVSPSRKSSRYPVWALRSAKGKPISQGRPGTLEGSLVQTYTQEGHTLYFFTASLLAIKVSDAHFGGKQDGSLGANQIKAGAVFLLSSCLLVFTGDTEKFPPSI